MYEQTFRCVGLVRVTYMLGQVEIALDNIMKECYTYTFG